MVSIPQLVAFALQADGWWLRSEIIWHKPNPMPESVTDRPTKAHEQVFLLTKSARYFYDAEAVKEPQSEGTHARFGKDGVRTGLGPKQTNSPNGLVRDKLKYNEAILPNGRNRRSVWTIPTQAYPEAHFATYPVALVEPCIKAGTSERGCCANCGAPWRRVVEKASQPTRPGNAIKTDCSRNDGGRSDRIETTTKTTGWQPTCDCGKGTGHSDRDIPETVPCTVLDPFAGSGTTLQVARILGRNAIGIELSAEYAELAKVRAMQNLEGNDDTRPLFEPAKPTQKALFAVQ